ncbi:hypothetical protein D918_06757 [Trichuris suis]|nr:hypothetical protein D918_06757 [Trichuris suis]
MKLTEMNLQLQGEDFNLIKTKVSFNAFVSKLLYFESNLAGEEFYYFRNVCEKEQRANQCTKREVYCRHLELLHQDFIERFEDILSLEVPGWITDTEDENAELQLKEVARATAR